MKFKMGCELSYSLEEETVFIFNLEVARLPRHRDLNEVLRIDPEHAREAYVDPRTGNRYLRVVAAAGKLFLRYEAEVDLDVYRADAAAIQPVPMGDLPLAILPYLLPSRFVPSDRLARFAKREFGEAPQGHARVSTICSWIYQNIDYQRGTSDAETTASEILLQRGGVCRDFAHLAIAFCRALGIPARFVTCYAYGLSPCDFHAVFEAYLGDRWYLFDATRQAALDGLVRIGVGRDAAEVAFATAFGKMTSETPRIWIDRADGVREEGFRTTDAISTEDTTA